MRTWLFLFFLEQLLLPLGLCLSFFHVSQSDPRNSLGSPLSLDASRHFSSSSSHLSVILLNLERFFDLFYYHKMDLPGARRQQGAPTEEQSGSEDGTLGLNFSSIITSQVASGKQCHSLASMAFPIKCNALWGRKAKATPVCLLVSMQLLCGCVPHFTVWPGRLCWNIPSPSCSSNDRVGCA